MTRKPDVTPPEPVPADSFAPRSDGDSFQPLTPEQEPQVWGELRQLLSDLVDKPATTADREAADLLLRRLGLDAALNPLFLTAIREAADLEKVIAAGVGKAAEAERLRREIGHYLTVTASDPQTNKMVAEVRERLSAEHTSASRLSEAASRAQSQLRFLHVWAWPLFTDTNPCPEIKDHMGEVRRQNAGILSTCIAPPKTSAAAREMGIDPFVIDSWRNLRRAEPMPARRRYRTTPISSPTSPVTLGQSPYSRF